jgi:1-acyl-sn-glycerol-3-phosphate acyltransferase
MRSTRTARKRGEDQVRRRKPRDLGPVLRLGAVTVPSSTQMMFRSKWVNGEAVPAKGPAIIVANHVSYIDPLVIASFVWYCGRVPRFLAKESLFGLPVVGQLLDQAGQIPVNRGTREAAQSLDAAVSALDDGDVVVIYPEGTVTRDPDFWPSTGKTGAARLALLKPDVPVVPVGQWGAQNAVDVYHHRYRLIGRKKVTVVAGAPLDVSRYAGAQPTTSTLRAMTDDFMAAITEQVAWIRGIDPPQHATAHPDAS